MTIVTWLARRTKAIAAFITAVLVWCQVIAAQDGGFTAITALEWVGLAIAVAGALGVYNATNAAPPGPTVPSIDVASTGVEVPAPTQDS